MNNDDDIKKDTSLDELLRRAGLENGGDVDGDAVKAVAKRAVKAKVTADAAEDAEESADGKAPADAELTEEEKERREDLRFYQEKEERARKAFRRFTDIENEGEEGMKVNLRSIFGGDMFASPTFRRNILYLLLLAVMAILYVANRYAFQREEIRREQLSKDLTDRKFKTLTIASELTEFSMRSNVEENLPDSTLRTSTKSSFHLTVPETDEE